MKNRIFKYLSVLAAVLLVSSCEWTPPTFNSSDSFVAYTGSSTNIIEEGGKVGIPVLVTAGLNAPAVSVTFEFDTDASTAVEGTNFSLVNDSKTLSVSQGWGYDTIWIQPIDNDIFTGNLDLVIKLVSNTQNYPFGVMSSHTAVIVDNEHPLGNWIGEFSVSAVDYWSYFGPETWSVTTSPDPDDVNNLIVLGIGTGYSEWTPITGVCDLEAGTITFAAGSEVGTHANYSGPLAIFLGDSDGNLFEEPIVGKINEDGSIYVDLFGIKFVGGLNAGLNYGVYETTWTPASKKAARVYPGPSEIKEIKIQ